MTEGLIRKLHSLPLRIHLLGMALLLAVPAAVLIIMSGMTRHAESVQKGFEAATNLNHSIADEQESMTGNIEQLLSTLEQLPEIEKRDTAATTALLSAIVRNSPQYANLIVADRSGEVWASALPLSASFSLKNRRSFRTALETAKFSSGDFWIGRSSGNPTLGFGYPILTGGGKLNGVILAIIDFEQFNALLPLTRVPEGSAFTIVGRNGMIVDRSLEPEKYVGTMIGKETFRRMQSGPEQATFIDQTLKDTNRIISYRKMTLRDERSPYLYIRTAFPLQAVLDQAQRALLMNIGVLFSLLLVVVSSVIYLGDILFLKRIHALQDCAQRLADGDLQVRAADAVAGGEIGQLGVVFDHMARNLSTRQASLVKSEQELHELNQNLTRRVEQETERRLNQERLLARHARLAAMGEMIAAIAHQWRQPLATLGATVQSIRMAWDHECLDEIFMKKAEEGAQKQLYYMSNTIEDFRNFFTLEKVAERFDVCAKIAEVITLISPRFDHSGVRLQPLDQVPGLYVRGYQNEFKQSLLNLVGNALDAVLEKMAQGAQPPAARGELGRVSLSAAGIGEPVVVEVVDDGCGIAPQHGDRVFDPYFTTKSGDKGTGIGLYMTRLIIEESMEGRLSFSSSPEGTRFRIELVRDRTSDEVDND